ncbi:MAG: GrpB family protein [Gemmatimonadota bacterium]|jgi:GrpB-like predicted nucleotidyltransferase (UPF0157 family)
MSEVVVQDYDPTWPRVFERLRSAVWPAVSDIAVGIEHVGSTSVPGLAAKPVVDIDVIVTESGVAIGIERLTTLGYTHRGDLGVTGREAFARPPGTPRHHLYLCVAGGTALANHLAIRDHLRANAGVAAAYGALKKRLAREFPDDIGGYIEAKTGFLAGILREAGFDEDTIAGIERLNAKRRT